MPKVQLRAFDQRQKFWRAAPPDYCEKTGRIKRDGGALLTPLSIIVTEW
jgi:hypothetical protein